MNFASWDHQDVTFLHEYITTDPSLAEGSYILYQIHVLRLDLKIIPNVHILNSLLVRGIAQSKSVAIYSQIT